MLGVVLVPVLVLVLVVGVVAVPPLAAATPRASAPSTWDPRIEPIAKKVEELRKLDFEHPVKVRFLSEAAFEKQQRGDRSDLSASDEKELQRTQSQLRALGLIGQEVDLFEAGNDISSSDVLAYYDPATKRVTVKGTGKLAPATKVTLAHELTHALQDQHFDLKRIQRAAGKAHASSAARALIEGDAVRVEELYRDQLSAADRKAADQQSQADAAAAQDEAQAESVPSALLALFEAPYAFGPALVQVADHLDGGIDDLFRHPPTREVEFLDPSTLVDHAEFRTVAQPKVTGTEKKVGPSDVFGAFGLYLVLGSRLDLDDALRAADGWGGDAMISFERDAKQCLRATFVGRDRGRTDAIATALDQWAASAPPGAAQVDRGGGDVTLTACDTGVAGPAAVHQGDEVLSFAAGRDTLYAGFLQNGLPSKTASCAAEGVVEDPAFAPLLAQPDQQPDDATVSELRTRASAIVQRCVTSGRK
jgi:hypothetical protein